MDADFDETTYEASLESNSSANANYHGARALSAAFYGHAAELERHAAAAMSLMPHVAGTFATLLIHIVQCLALAGRIRAAAPAERPALFAEFDVCHNWLAMRAADSPSNFLYLLALIEAERTWAAGDFQAALTAFDTALYEVQLRQRPGHRALIAERAALFHLAHGLEHTGRQMLAEARKFYELWGAAGKVAQLNRDYPFLSTSKPIRTGERRSSSISSDAVDLLAVIRASQALSSETNLDRLRARVVEQLGAMTGATGVSVVLRYDDPQEWRLLSTADGASLSVEEAGAQGLLPLSAFRYAERNREPLLIADATRDDRFARDLYMAGLDQCSLLVVPILSQGTPRAILLLENRLSRGAFSPARLDAVLLIAGQLAVSLDNALLYGSLERKVADRTAELEAANLRLEALSITDALTGLANRRRFAETLEAEWVRAYRAQGPIAAAMIDIDRFKQYNDVYGHLCGDACLRLVAETLSESIRHDLDLVARYGGEEFAIILPGADLAAAEAVAERARASVAALNEPHEGSPYGIVTVSIGIAAVVPQAETGSELLLSSADGALYRAKNDGRNRVVSASGAGG
jgi:diguanylate cyclase (GGDEF)-like protein